MKPVLINAKAFKEHKIEYLKNEVKALGRKPRLVIISASEDMASKNYIRNKVRIGEEVGIDVDIMKMDESVTTDVLLEFIHDLNNDTKVDGIILQLPVYPHLDGSKLIKSISPSKDADCFNSIRLGDLLQNTGNIRPCTPKGVIDLLEFHNVGIKGKNVVVIGKSVHVGLSLSIMLTQKGATVSTCHSNTTNLIERISGADIVISCVGKMNLIDPTWMKENSILVGVGITVDENFKQQTDYSIDAMMDHSKCAMVGDRVNTTGTTTVLALIENVVMLAKA